MEITLEMPNERCTYYLKLIINEDSKIVKIIIYFLSIIKLKC